MYVLRGNPSRGIGTWRPNSMGFDSEYWSRLYVPTAKVLSSSSGGECASGSVLLLHPSHMSSYKDFAASSRFTDSSPRDSLALLIRYERRSENGAVQF
jgi:hypothetical protein